MNDKERDREREIQEKCRQLVGREVCYCVSGLISTLARGYDGSRGALGELCEKAFELSSSIQDFESAAFDEGWRVVEEDGVTYMRHPATECPDCGEVYGHGQTTCPKCVVACKSVNDSEYGSWQECCEGERIEPHEIEVYEHWLVSDWLAAKLAAHGEKVDTDFDGATVWARTTTGQAIYLDGVIREIWGDIDRKVA